GSKMNIVLDGTNMLDEVIAVAYGTTKKSEYTGAASVIDASQLETALVSNVTNAIAGKIAGVQTLSSNGQPGTTASVRIRGVGSINATADPLYVVDGMPFDGDIATIPATDIEAMTVLKDAASTALYGARGANGVILITTKSGRSGAAKVSVDVRWGSNSRAVPQYDVITDQRQYLVTAYNALYMTAMDGQAGADAKANPWVYANNAIWGALGYQTWTVPTGQTLIGSDGKFNPNATPGYSNGRYYFLADNWEKETLIHGLRQEYNASITGGTDKLNYYISGSYLGDEGIISGSHFNRMSTRANADYQAKSWLKIGANM
ncbi:TonB-dependent receptor plug domain-containing protein, partial [uncultured Duncaniella sp.]